MPKYSQASQTYHSVRTVVHLLAQATSVTQLLSARDNLWTLLSDKHVTGPVGDPGEICGELQNLLSAFRNNPEKDAVFQIVDTTKTVCGTCTSVTRSTSNRYNLQDQVFDEEAFAQTGVSRLTAAAMEVEKELECKYCGCYTLTKYRVGFTFKKCVVLTHTSVLFTNTFSAYGVRERVESTDFDLVFVAVRVGLHYVGIARGSSVHEWIVYDNKHPHRLVSSLSQAADVLAEHYPNPQRELRLKHAAEVFVYKVVVPDN